MQAELQALSAIRGEVDLREISEAALDVLIWGFNPHKRRRAEKWWRTLTREEKEAWDETFSEELYETVHSEIWEAARRDPQEATELLREWMRDKQSDASKSQ